MSDEANIVLSMELEQKVKEQVLNIIQQNPWIVATVLMPILVNDESFIKSMTRQIGNKMNAIY